MSFLAAYRAGSPAPRGWSPFALASDLLAWWDAERSDLITQSGGAVSSWKDIVGGYDAVQTTGASKPTYSATGFNGRAGIYADGVDDCLTVTPVPAGVLTGAAPNEEWFLVDQLMPSTDANLVTVGCTGGVNTSTSRRLRRISSSGVNRAQSIDTAGFAANTAVDFSGRHVVRIIATDTQSTCEVDGAAGAFSSQTPAIATTRMRFFADPANVPAGFSLCGIAARLCTAPLSVSKAAQLYAYLSRRL